MIYGVGQDLVEIPRIERALARFGERFARRMRRCSSRSFNAGVNCSSGLPERRLTTHTPCQFAGA